MYTVHWGCCNCTVDWKCQQGWVGKGSPDPEHFSHFGLIQCVCFFYFSSFVVD